MTDQLSIRFAPLAATPEAVTVVLCGSDLALASRAKQLNSQSGEAITRAAAAADFKGRKRQTLEILAPRDIAVQRLIAVGVGAAAELSESDWVNLGGLILAQITARKTASACLLAEWPGDKGDGKGGKGESGEAKRDPAQIAADLAFGALLRSYAFNKYRTRRRDDEDGGDSKADGKAEVKVEPKLETKETKETTTSKR